MSAKCWDVHETRSLMQLQHHRGLQCFSRRVFLCPLEAWNRVPCSSQLKERTVEMIFPHYHQKKIWNAEKKQTTLGKTSSCLFFFSPLFCFCLFLTWALLWGKLLKPVLVFNYTSTNKNFANICFCLCLYTLWSNSLKKKSVEEFATQAEASFAKFYLGSNPIAV